MSKSFLGIQGYPLGLRNNNPGNLRPLPNGQKWVGEIEPDHVKNFSRFSDISYGLRAMITDLLGDVRNKKLNTIRKLIYSYAPPSDNNNTQAYMTRVSQLTGLKPDEVIPLTSEAITRLVQAQLSVELGPAFAAKITQADIAEAIHILSPNVQRWLVIATAAGGGLLLLFIVAGFLLFKE